MVPSLRPFLKRRPPRHPSASRSCYVLSLDCCSRGLPLSSRKECYDALAHFVSRATESTGLPPPTARRHMSPTQLALVVVAGLIGGVMNSVAGGGTMVTFPALVALGLPAINANGTSTVALWPG